MLGNHRGPVYAALQAYLKRVLTPNERQALDRLIDGMPKE
jgi:hypothetical protein